MSSPIKIFIVDDEQVIREALTLLLETAGYAVASFAGGTEFLDAYTPHLRGCIVLDLSMPGMDGVALHEELRRRGSLLPVIFLTGHGTIPITVRALKTGAMNFLTKPVDGTELLVCIREALKQQSLLRKQEQAQLSVASQLSMLSKREREIMKLIVAGHTSKEIAQYFAISHRTVEVHRAHVMRKTGASSIPELVRIARSAGVVKSQ
jgi:FixJ family two-component response regulator